MHLVIINWKYCPVLVAAIRLINLNPEVFAEFIIGREFEKILVKDQCFKDIEICTHGYTRISAFNFA